MKLGAEKQIIDLDWLEFDNFVKSVLETIKDKLYK